MTRRFSTRELIAELDRELGMRVKVWGAPMDPAHQVKYDKLREVRGILDEMLAAEQAKEGEQQTLLPEVNG